MINPSLAHTEDRDAVKRRVVEPCKNKNADIKTKPDTSSCQVMRSGGTKGLFIDFKHFVGNWFGEIYVSN